MSPGDQNQHQHIQRSTDPFENIKIRKGWGLERGTTHHQVIIVQCKWSALYHAFVLG